AIQPRGFWTSYQYDTNGFLTAQVSQFLNAPTNAPTNQCRVTSYSYTSIGGATYSQTTVQTLLGQEIARSYYLTFPNQGKLIVCQTPGAAWNAADNLVT